MDQAPRLLQAKRKGSDDLVVKAPCKIYPPKRNLKEFIVRRDFPLLYGKQDSPPVSKDLVLTNSNVDLVEATHVSKDNLLIDGTVDAFTECKYVLEGNSVIKGQHMHTLRDNRELIPSRNEVKEVLRLYHKVLNELLKESRKGIMRKHNVHLVAAWILRRRHNWLNTMKRFGSIPGVEVGDEFEFRAELCIIGLHHPFEKGIDYFEKDGIKLATSIVSSGRYPNFMNSFDVLIYSGEGGNPSVRKKHPLKDQVLKHGNLALKNNLERKVPVRVIIKQLFKGSKRPTYVYDGLYHVEKCWRERGNYGKLIFKFKLRRVLGQPPRIRGLELNLDKYSSKRKHILASDTFEDNKNVVVAMTKRFDNDKLSPYVADGAHSVVSDQFMSSSCDCIDGCSYSEDCACKIKNGKVFPYDYNERLVGRKPRIFECGPSCKCSGSCINRVSQRGIRFQLQVFTTKTGRPGVRSKDYIPVGSFVCEYIGARQAKEGKGEVGQIKHSFDMTNNHVKRICQNDRVLPLHSFSEKECRTEEVSKFDDVGRFINHSFSPNLHVQHVLYGDSKMPHLMLFAMKDILPLHELTYDYNSRTKF